MKTRRLQIISVLLALCLIAVADVRAGSGDAGRESPFTVGAGARALGMGGAFTGLSDDASTMYYNPAGLAVLEWQELALMHMVLPEGTSYEFASWVYPTLDFGGFGVAYMRLSTGEIVRRQDFADLGEFDFHHDQFVVSYGRRLIPQLSLGASMKVVNQSIDNQSDYGVGFDLGVRLLTCRYFSIGAIARDLAAPELQLGAEPEATSHSVAGGFALHRLPISQYVKLTIAGDLEHIEDRSLKIHAGGEVILHEHYQLRAGFDRDNFTVGAGVHIGRVRVDYGYKSHEFLDDSHRFSLSFLLGRSVSQQKTKRREIEEKLAVPPERDLMSRQFALYKEKGDGYYAADELDSALIYYQRALAFDEGNEEIRLAISSVERILEDRRQREALQRQAEREAESLIDNTYRQAEHLYQRRQYPAALDLLELIFDIDPENGRAQSLRGMIRQAMAAEIRQRIATAVEAEEGGDLVAAIDAYNRVLELDPSNTSILEAKRNALASLDLARQLKAAIQFYNEGQLAESRKRLVSILEVNPNESVAKEYLQRIDAQSQPTSQSTLEELQRDKEIWPVYLEGLRHMRNKDYRKAIDAWEQVLKKYPNSTNTLDNIEQARLRLNAEKSD